MSYVCALLVVYDPILSREGGRGGMRKAGQDAGRGGGGRKLEREPSECLCSAQAFFWLKGQQRQKYSRGDVARSSRISVSKVGRRVGLLFRVAVLAPVSECTLTGIWPVRLLRLRVLACARHRTLSIKAIFTSTSPSPHPSSFPSSTSHPSSAVSGTSS